MDMVKQGIAAVLLYSLQAAATSEPAPEKTVKLKSTSPHTVSEIELTKPDRQQYKLGSFRGSVTLVHFWATWCSPCLRELPELQALRDRYNDKKLRIFAIAADSHNAVTKYLSKHTTNLDILIDQYGGALRAYKVKSLPSTFIINQDGKISYQAKGPVDWTSTEVIHTIKTLLMAEY